MPGGVGEPRGHPGSGAGARLPLVALALALFGLLIGLAWVRAGGVGEPAWLQQAMVRAAAMGAAGHPWAPSAAISDPRAGLGALLLLAGMAPATVGLLLRAFGVALGAGGVLLLAGPPDGWGRPGERRQPPMVIGALPACLLASSTYWVEASLEADPTLALALLFWLLAYRRGAAWLLGIALAWALSWSPWAWLALWPLAWMAALRATRGTGGAVA